MGKKRHYQQSIVTCISCRIFRPLLRFGRPGQPIWSPVVVHVVASFALLAGFFRAPGPAVTCLCPPAAPSQPDGSRWSDPSASPSQLSPGSLRVSGLHSGSDGPKRAPAESSRPASASSSSSSPARPAVEQFSLSAVAESSSPSPGRIDFRPAAHPPAPTRSGRFFSASMVRGMLTHPAAVSWCCSSSCRLHYQLNSIARFVACLRRQWRPGGPSRFRHCHHPLRQWLRLVQRAAIPEAKERNSHHFGRIHLASLGCHQSASQRLAPSATQRTHAWR